MAGERAWAALVAGTLLVAPDAAAREASIHATSGPPELPGLSHPDLTFNFEYTIASAEPTDVISYEPIDGARAFAYSARWLLEYPLVPHHWYVGAAHDIAAATVPSGQTPDSGGHTIVLGNPELWVRGMWTSRSGLGAGGGLGVVVPVPRAFSTLEAEVVRAIRVVRPWDYPHFLDRRLTARPFFDIRHVTGPVTLQLRQGLDLNILLREDRPDGENRYDLSALASVYVGVRALDQLTLGLELEEVYHITAAVDSPACPEPCDEHRVALAVSPSAVLEVGPVKPAISVLLPVSTPLRAEVASYYAARLHLEAAF